MAERIHNSFRVCPRTRMGLTLYRIAAFTRSTKNPAVYCMDESTGRPAEFDDKDVARTVGRVFGLEEIVE